jgi:putative membrane protein insertion efficiency factor
MRRVAEAVLLALIRVYRYTISPLMGSNCRFYPSCSAYALDAVRLHGPWRGAYLALRRLSRCHPWHEGGLDPVPVKRERAPRCEMQS